LPLIPGKLALRVVGSYEETDGYMENGAAYGPITGFVPSKFNGEQGTGTGEDTGGIDVFSGRIKLLWEPTDTFSAFFKYEAVRDDTEFEATVNESPPEASFSALGLGAGGTGNPHKIGGTTNRSDVLLELPDIRVDIDGYFLNMDWDVDFGTFSSITGYREQESRLAGSETGNPAVTAADGDVLSPFDINRADDRETFQQELRFSSSFDGSVNFVAGAFYQEEDIDFCVVQVLGFLDLFGQPTSVSSFFGVDYGTYNDNAYLLCNAQESESAAVYAEATFDVSDRITITAGARYTDEDKKWLGRQQIFSQELGGFSDPSFTWQNLGEALDASVYKYPFGVVTVKDSTDETTWRLMASYQFSDDIFTYANYSRGFKAGGFNDQIGSFGAFGDDLDLFAVAAESTDPETADSFELGVKIDALDGLLRVNVTGFYVEYDDLQRQIVVPLQVGDVVSQVTKFFNAASAEVWGIEAEATWLATDELTLRGVFGYQDCDLKEFDSPGAGYDLSTADCERAPELQWTIDATYQAPIFDAWKIAINANVNYTDENLYTQSIESPDLNTFLDERTLWNATITISDGDDRYYGRLIGKNLTDETYKVATQVVAGLWTFTNYGPPRYYAFEVGFNW